MLQCTIGRRCAAAIAAAVLACVAQAQPSSSPDATQALAGPALVAALRAGGLTLYFRHTATDFSQNDRAMTTHDECSTQRMITSHGNPFRAIAGPPHLQEGEAAVLRGNGKEFVVVARIGPGDWPALVGAAAR